MSELALVAAVAGITYASRVLFLLQPRVMPPGRLSRFLEMFPLALFLAIATSALRGGEGSGEVATGLVAAVGGILGAVLFRRSLLGILVVGASAFYLSRALL